MVMLIAWGSLFNKGKGLFIYENMGHYTREWIEKKKQFMLGQLKGWCEQTVFVECEKRIV